MYTLCEPNCGAKRTWSIKLRMSSTELFDAASNSNTFNDCPLLKEVQLSHLSQASVSSVKLKQLMVLAKIRAQVVLPTPRGPQNKKACAKCLLFIAFFNVLVMELCPTTVSNVAGRYLRADTIKLSILAIILNDFFQK